MTAPPLACLNLPHRAMDTSNRYEAPPQRLRRPSRHTCEVTRAIADANEAGSRLNHTGIPCSFILLLAPGQNGHVVATQADKLMYAELDRTRVVLSSSTTHVQGHVRTFRGSTQGEPQSRTSSFGRATTLLETLHTFLSSKRTSFLPRESDGHPFVDHTPPPIPLVTRLPPSVTVPASTMRAKRFCWSSYRLARFHGHLGSTKIVHARSTPRSRLPHWNMSK